MAYQTNIESISILPRKIKLTKAKEGDVFKSLKVLRGAGLADKDLSKIMTEWKSQRTISMRRSVFTISFLVIGSFYVGVDVFQFNFFGLGLQNGSAERFYFLIGFLLLVSALFYYFFIFIDFSVREGKLRFLDSLIEACDKSMYTLEKISRESEVSVSDLIKDFTGPSDKENHDELASSLNSLSVYRKYWRGPKGLNKVFDYGEKAIVFVLVCASLVILYFA